MLKEEIEQIIKVANNETNRLEKKYYSEINQTERARIYKELTKVEERRRTLAEVLKIVEKYEAMDA